MEKPEGKNHLEDPGVDGSIILRWIFRGGMCGYVARVGDRRDAYRLLVWKPEGKSPRGRPRRRWEDNIKMDLQSVGLIWLRIVTGGGY